MIARVAVAWMCVVGSALAAELDLDGDGWSQPTDCDDADPAVNPGAHERCNKIDDDCDDLIDDDDDRVRGGHNYWLDADGDRVGGPISAKFCVQPAGYVAAWGDCDDTDATGAYWTISYEDADGDGYGGQHSQTCGPAIPPGHLTSGGDCDDTDASIHPGGVERCNHVDDDCDWLVDLDDPELVTKVYYDDVDRDGYGDDLTADATGCTPPHGYVSVGGDCDATEVATHPNAPEICDGEDNDCDGGVDESTVSVEWYLDADGDAYGVPTETMRACRQPPGYARGRGDCDDADTAIAPNVDEVCGNGIDDDCDGGKDNCTVPADVADFAIEGSEDVRLSSELEIADFDGDGVADVWVGLLGFTGPASGVARPGDAVRSVTSGGGALSYGDANGDGFGDLLVGVNLFLGPMSASTDASDADAWYWNDGNDTALGYAVKVMGDYDGDGIPDLAIGSPGEVLKRGTVCVVSGDLIGGHDLQDDSTYRYRSGELDRAGTTVDSFDENGDGLDDLLFGAPWGGAAYMVDGGAPPGSYGVPEGADATFVGHRGALDGFGWKVAFDDLDGDGYGDAIVSAPGAFTSLDQPDGVVYAFLGPLAGTTHGRAADIRWEGDADESGHFGDSLATGSDIDGDGEVDTLIGDPYEHATDTSVVYVQLGRTHGVVALDELMAIRSAESDLFGWDVAFVPDWDGDGFAEIAASAPYADDDAGESVGRVSVFFSDSLFE
jgi:hypothetical protein